MTQPSLNVSLNGQSQRLGPGEIAAVPSASLYRDAPDQLLATITADIAAGVPWREAAHRHLASVNPWLLRVVTDPARSRWLELNPPPRDSWVLDVGCGWGQWAIPAAAAANVVALEPTPARLAVARAIADQERRLDRMFFVGASLEDADFPEQRFDRIYCIGVLEWVPRFRPDADPIEAQRIFLRRLQRLLAPGGECIIGIENRFGLKYLLGARDDHTGLPGISVFDAATADRLYRASTGNPLRVFTHTRAEYQELLGSTGYSSTEFFAAFPDYKVPEVILPVAGGAVDRHCAATALPAEHDGCNGAPLPIAAELASHYRSLAQLGIAGNFAPSFFIRARGAAN